MLAVSITAAHSPSPRGRPTTIMADLLILLHHARKCHHGEDDDECPVSPDCAATKRLWRHIAHCKHKKCPHCYSARRLLTHYRDCKDGNCMVCGPVREVVRRSREKKTLEQQQMQGISKTDTFSTSMTTAPSAGQSKTTIDEWVSLRRDNLMTIDGTSGNVIGQSLTLEASPARPPIIPVRRGRSFGSMSSLSHCSSIPSSTRSSVPSNRSGSSRGSDVYCSECRRLGGMQATRVCSSGIRCRTNLGIAHFCKPCPEEGSQK
mmetsp:Transcript_30435/g.63647  ORF Transcript_30435/g.63647 Transcript_30435/m.63647 type:complete len:262 (-) Transcript_30435:847-1632(-)